MAPLLRRGVVIPDPFASLIVPFGASLSPFSALRLAEHRSLVVMLRQDCRERVPKPRNCARRGKRALLSNPASLGPHLRRRFQNKLPTEHESGLLPPIVSGLSELDAVKRAGRVEESFGRAQT